MNPRLPPPTSIRGQVKRWVASRADRLVPTVVEVGARRKEGTWWADYRDVMPVPGTWIGVDLQGGPHVDVLADICDERCADYLRLMLQDRGEADGRCNTVITTEMLEHVRHPLKALQNMLGILRPGGSLLLSTVFAWVFHEEPRDFWRFSVDGIRELALEAGFAEAEAEWGGLLITHTLNDHGDIGDTKHKIHTHVFLTATA